VLRVEGQAAEGPESDSAPSATSITRWRFLVAWATGKIPGMLAPNSRICRNPNTQAESVLVEEEMLAVRDTTQGFNQLE
jgi:hypothetical protein